MAEPWLFNMTAARNVTRKILFKTTSTTTTSLPVILSSNDSGLFEDTPGDSLSSLSLLALIILYGIVVFSGVCGNTTLLVSLCSQSTTRVKNPLLLALCSADLLVTLVSASPPEPDAHVLHGEHRMQSFPLHAGTDDNFH
jgi:hypothetical protein